MDTTNFGEIVLYHPDESIRLEVRLEEETVWLNRQQMATLFDRDVKTIGKHVNNALREELRDYSTVANFATVQGNALLEERQAFQVVAKFATTAANGKVYQMEYYNLDMILSVGYRVKSQRSIQFRQWSNRVLKEYLLRGYAIKKQIEQFEKFTVETGRQVTEISVKLDFLKQYIESIVTDQNDINEDTRMQLDIIGRELAELQVRHRELNRPRTPIGFIKPETDR